MLSIYVFYLVNKNYEFKIPFWNTYQLFPVFINVVEQQRTVWVLQYLFLITEYFSPVNTWSLVACKYLPVS